MRVAADSDILLTTHGHYDHYNLPFLRAFKGQQLYIRAGTIEQGDVGQTKLTDAQMATLGRIDVMITQFDNSYSNMSVENGKAFVSIEPGKLRAARQAAGKPLLLIIGPDLERRADLCGAKPIDW